MSQVAHAYERDTPTYVGKVKFFILHIYFAGVLPLVWEKVYLLVIVSIQYGITPTRVGKSEERFYITISAEDHSHSCGKKTQCFQAKLGFHDNFVMKFFTINSRVTSITLNHFHHMRMVWTENSALKCIVNLNSQIIFIES